jgi:hypothetical protein
MQTDPPAHTNLATYIVGVLGSFLIVVALVWVMYNYTRPAPVGQARVEERKKNLAELRAANVEILNNYGWQDQAKGIVRVPITNAMELILREYQNPAVARSNLIAIAEKAAVPPPKPPEKPNPFE